MADNNTLIKDGVGNQFQLRSKDIAGTLRRSMVYATNYPVDYDGGGCYKIRVKSGTMAAGLAADSPIVMFRYVSSSLQVLVKKIRFGAWSLGTGFAAGIATFNVFVARDFTIEDTGGSLAVITGNAGKLRTTMQPSIAVMRYSSTATLTAGTRTLDPVAIDGIDVAIGTTTYTQMLVRTDLLDCQPGEHPLLLGNNEGFIIQATVPATGTWAYGISVEIDEVPYY